MAMGSPRALRNFDRFNTIEAEASGICAVNGLFMPSECNLRHDQAAIDVDRLAGNIGCIIAGEEGHKAGNIIP